MFRKDYPVISKNMARQRLITPHTHLSGKLSAGVLNGHPQVHSHYQYDNGVTLSNSDPQEPFPSGRESSLLYHCFKHRGTVFVSSKIYILLFQELLGTLTFAINFSIYVFPMFLDNNRHLELGCKRPYLDAAPSAVSEEHYFCSPSSYESSLLSHPYCGEALGSREACMYGGMDGEVGAVGVPATEDMPPPSLNCNMWASVQPYPRYGMQTVEAVPYQPFSAHLTSSATTASIVSHHSGSIQRPQPAPQVPDLVSFGTQSALQPVPSSSSSSSSSPSGASSCERSAHIPLYPRKPGSPLRVHRDLSGYPNQSPRESVYQYQMGLSSSIGSHWTDS